jgi:hypothetical protein
MSNTGKPSWLRRLLGREPASQPASQPAEPRPQPRSRFHAVSIAVGRTTCRQVEALIGTRFLGSDAPKLPLSGCDSGDCRCRYIHHTDRRKEDDRRLRDIWKMGKVNAGEDRRRKSGRRGSDG